MVSLVVWCSTVWNEGVKSCRHYPVCAVTEGFSGEGLVSSLQSDYAAHIILTTRYTSLYSKHSLHAVWSVTWWNVEHYAASTVYEPSVVHTHIMSFFKHLTMQS